jgi:hypothetical protein
MEKCQGAVGSRILQSRHFSSVQDTWYTFRDWVSRKSSPEKRPGRNEILHVDTERQLYQRVAIYKTLILDTQEITFEDFLFKYARNTEYRIRGNVEWRV